MSTSAERLLDRRTSTSGSPASLLWRNLQKKLGEVRARGLGAVLRKAFSDHIYRTSEWVILERVPEVSQSGNDPVKQGSVIVIEPGDPIPDLSRYFSASQAATAEATIRAGCTGFFAVKDGDVIGYAFGARKDYFDTLHHMWFPVRTGEGYMFAWLVAADQRSFAVASRIEKASAAHMAARGCRRLYCAVDSTNTSSLGTLLFLGYQETGELLKIRLVFRRPRSTTKVTYREPRFARYQRKRNPRHQAHG